MLDKQLLLLLMNAIASYGAYLLVTNGTQLTYEEAMHRCDEVGGSLPRMDGGSVEEEFLTSMRSLGVDDVWLGVQAHQANVRLNIGGVDIVVRETGCYRTEFLVTISNTSETDSIEECLEKCHLDSYWFAGLTVTGPSIQCICANWTQAAHSLDEALCNASCSYPSGCGSRINDDTYYRVFTTDGRRVGEPDTETVSTPSTATDYDSRLIDGGHDSRGRLEVYFNNTWGTICQYGFGYNEATAACRKLGYLYGSVRRETPSRALPIHWRNVSCPVNARSLADCRLHPPHNCTHYDDVGVECSNHSVRLTGGKDGAEGRLEVFHDGQWGTVCDNFFGHREATVVCTMLGYKFGVTWHNAYYGAGTGAIHLDNVSCGPYATNLFECRHDAWGEHDCDEVGVQCGMTHHTTTSADGVLRLTSGLSRGAGVLEAYVFSAWRQVCKGAIPAPCVDFICRTIGFSRGGLLASGDDMAENAQPYPYYPEVNCVGAEDTIHDAIDTSKIHGCEDTNSIGVVCAPELPWEGPPHKYMDYKCVTEEISPGGGVMFRETDCFSNTTLICCTDPDKDISLLIVGREDLEPIEECRRIQGVPVSPRHSCAKGSLDSEKKVYMSSEIAATGSLNNFAPHFIPFSQWAYDEPGFVIDTCFSMKQTGQWRTADCADRMALMCELENELSNYTSALEGANTTGSVFLIGGLSTAGVVVLIAGSIILVVWKRRNVKMRASHRNARPSLAMNSIYDEISETNMIPDMTTSHELYEKPSGFNNEREGRYDFMMTSPYAIHDPNDLTDEKPVINEGRHANTDSHNEARDLTYAEVNRGQQDDADDYMKPNIGLVVQAITGEKEAGFNQSTAHDETPPAVPAPREDDHTYLMVVE